MPHSIEAVVPARAALTEIEAEAIVRLAHLAISIDGDTNDEETAAFRALVGRVRSAIGIEQSPYRGTIKGARALTDDEYIELLDTLQSEIEHVSFDEHLRDLADRLERSSARQLAFRVVYALHVCDLAVHRKEEAFERDLASALKLDEEQAAALVDDVTRVLSLES